MTDNITLRRAVGDEVRDLLCHADFTHFHFAAKRREMLLRAATALAALDAALAEPVHPGYIIGSHWLETAYSRIAAGEAEADVLAEVLGERGWVKPDAKREPATEKQVAEVFKLSGAVYWGHYRNGWREAERFHGIRKEDGK